MIGVCINVVLVLLGSTLGLLLKNRFSERLGKAVVTGIGLCVVGIGMSSLLKTADTLCVIVCMVLGILLGEWINIERRMDALGQLLKSRVGRGNGQSQFVEAFVSATILYCVGAMAINGSIEAGINHDYSIVVSKSVMDGVTSITFSAAMGVGVAFSVIPIFLYQGALTVLAEWVGPYLDPAVVNEMSAVGGAIIVGIAINLLELRTEKVKVGNMLPAIFLPMIYVPVSRWLSGILG